MAHINNVERPERSRREPMFYVYILRNFSNQLYIGQTNNLEKRLHEHILELTKSSKFVKDNHNFKLVYSEEFLTRLEAMRREKQLKDWTRAKKEALISKNIELLKRL